LRFCGKSSDGMAERIGRQIKPTMDQGEIYQTFPLKHALHMVVGFAPPDTRRHVSTRSLYLSKFAMARFDTFRHVLKNCISYIKKQELWLVWCLNCKWGCADHTSRSKWASWDVQ
jgi:hypothetical protein